MTNSGLQKRVSEFLIMFLTGILSLGLLAYIGDREAFTKYPRFEIEKVVAQSRPVQQTLEKFLDAGLPLTQFAGFDTLVRPIIRVDDAIDAITIVSSVGAVVFQQTDPRYMIDPIAAVSRNLTEVTTVSGPTQTQIFLPIRSRFGFGGQVVIHLPNKYVAEKVRSATQLLPWAAGLGAIILGVYGALVVDFSVLRRRRLDRIIFSLIFLSVAGTVVVGLTKLYATGSQVKAEGLASALTERIRTIYDMGLKLDDVDALEAAFEAYRSVNPEIGALALVVDDRVVIGTNPGMTGKRLAPDSTSFQVLNPIEGVPGLNAAIYVSVPYDVAITAVGRTAKTFVVLLVASGFMAGLFFNLGDALRRLRLARSQNTTDGQSAVDAIKPVLFMGFLVENLAVSFLPQLMQKSATAGGLPPSLASLMFMAYFVTFAATLVPAGIFAGKRGPKPLILVGAAATAAASAIMALYDNYQVIVAARLLAGFGQALLFIGSQSYILAYAAADKRTQSAGVIVYTFNGGMLSGMVIGGLLAGYIGSSGVFWIGAATAVAIGLYTWALIDPAPITEKKPAQAAPRGPFSILGVFRSVSFLWTTLLVGIPAKAVLTGVIVFAMPLLLSGQNLAQEDIGQIIMFYALGVLLSSHFVSRYADRAGNIRQILFVGLALSGIGLCVIGGVGWRSVVDLQLGPIALTLILLGGTFLVGVGHGCINAPVVTHIAGTDVAKRLGEAPVTAFYRFIERIGHIAGPLVVGQLFFLSGQSPTAIAWLGAAMIAFALFFVVRSDRARA
jgi:MFS family permease